MKLPLKIGIPMPRAWISWTTQNAKIEKPQTLGHSVLKPMVDETDPNAGVLCVWMDKRDHMVGLGDVIVINGGKTREDSPIRRLTHNAQMHVIGMFCGMIAQYAYKRSSCQRIQKLRGVIGARERLQIHFNDLIAFVM